MFSYPSLINRILSTSDWKSGEYFDIGWKKRIRVMSQYIPGNSSVLDLGCGLRWLQKIRKVKKYYPVDYKPRGKGTIVCDFNSYEFPDVKADCAFVSGCLEYVIDYEWFIKQIAHHTKKCIVSYCTTDNVPNIFARSKANWKNNISQKRLIALFAKYNFTLNNIDNSIADNTIFVYTKTYPVTL